MMRLAIDRNGEPPALRGITLAAPGKIVRRSIAAAVMLCVGALLASCAGTSNEDPLSAFVADHWPHWAGGMPSDVPPRPGAPGYNRFIAHGQADQDVPPANGAAAPAAPVTPVFQTAPSGPAASAPAPAASAEPVSPPQQSSSIQPSPQSPAEDSNVVRGGLY
jgi:hypothetical protein